MPKKAPALNAGVFYFSPSQDAGFETKSKAEDICQCLLLFESSVLFYLHGFYRRKVSVDIFAVYRCKSSDLERIRLSRCQLALRIGNL